MFDCDFTSTAWAQHGHNYKPTATCGAYQWETKASGGLWIKYIRQHWAAKDTTHGAKRRDGLQKRAILASSTRFPQEIAFN